MTTMLPFLLVKQYTAIQAQHACRFSSTLSLTKKALASCKYDGSAHTGTHQSTRKAHSDTKSQSAEDHVQIVEVGPRDGLQNEAKIVSTQDKIRLITLLAEAGCTNIEAASFVSPKWVPNMANSLDVMHGLSFLRERFPSLQLASLVPNLVGLEGAIQAKSNEVAIFTSASEAFCQKVEL
jgi:HMGL-like